MPSITKQQVRFFWKKAEFIKEPGYDGQLEAGSVNVKDLVQEEKNHIKHTFRFWEGEGGKMCKQKQML